jgi:hypothetical protein
MDTYPDSLIKDLADKVKKKILGGKLYGKIVTEDDINALIVASYLMSKEEETGERSIYKLMSERSL